MTSPRQPHLQHERLNVQSAGLNLNSSIKHYQRQRDNDNQEYFEYLVCLLVGIYFFVIQLVCRFGLISLLGTFVTRLWAYIDFTLFIAYQLYHVRYQSYSLSKDENKTLYCVFEASAAILFNVL